MNGLNSRIRNQWSAMFVGLALVGACATIGRTDSTLVGTVQDIPPGRIVVSMSTELLTFTVTAQTSVSLDGRSATVADLQPGDAVRVTSNVDAEGATVALRIVAARHSAAVPVL